MNQVSVGPFDSLVKCIFLEIAYVGYAEYPTLVNKFFFLPLCGFISGSRARSLTSALHRLLSTAIPVPQTSTKHLGLPWLWSWTAAPYHTEGCAARERSHTSSHSTGQAGTTIRRAYIDLRVPAQSQ